MDEWWKTVGFHTIEIHQPYAWGYPDRGWSTMIKQVTSGAHWTYQNITPKKSPYLSIFQIIMINYIKIMKVRVPFDRKPSRCKLTTLRKDSCYSCCWSASDAWAFASVVLRWQTGQGTQGYENPPADWAGASLRRCCFFLGRKWVWVKTWIYHIGNHHP